MPDMWGATMWGAQTPFKGRFYPPKRTPKSLPVIDIEDFADKVNEIYPPRGIKLGISINAITGEEEGDFWLPFDDTDNEPSMAVIGPSGSGKSVLMGRLIDELVRMYGRSAFIVDVKQQYKRMNKANTNPAHVKILREFGEEPAPIKNIKVYIPKHLEIEEGVDDCQAWYGYTDTWAIRTDSVSPADLLMLGNKEVEGKDYVNILAGVFTVMKKAVRTDGIKFDMETLREYLDMEAEETPAKKRSVDTLVSMLDTLEKTEVISDDGNDILELFHKPRITQGDISIFNVAGTGADDIQTKGLVTNLVNAMCHRLKREYDKETLEPLYRPMFFLEEASRFYGKDCDVNMLSAFNKLQNVDGRSLGILRCYVYQYKEQAPKGLFENDNMQLILEPTRNLVLPSGVRMNGKGYCKITLRNVSFSDKDEIFYCKVIPPRSSISS